MSPEFAGSPMPDMQMQQIIAKAEGGQPEAQFLLSQICLQQQDLDGMVHWLQQASKAQPFGRSACVKEP